MDATTFMRALVRFARELEAQGTVTWATGITPVQAAILFFANIMDERAAATIGLFAAGLDAQDPQTRELATLSLAALIAGVADAVVVQAGDATFRYEGETLTPGDPRPTTHGGLPPRPADVIGPVQRTIPAISFTTTSAGGGRVRLDLTPAVLDFRKRYYACIIEADGSKRCGHVSPHVLPREWGSQSGVPLRIGHPYYGSTSQLLLVKNVHTASDQRATLSFVLPPGINGFDVRLKSWTLEASPGLPSWEGLPEVLISSSTSGPIWSRLLQDDLGSWPTPTYMTGTETLLLVEPPDESSANPYYCPNGVNPLSVCSYHGHASAEGSLVGLWSFAAASYWRTPAWRVGEGDTVTVVLFAPATTTGDSEPYGCVTSGGIPCYYTHGVDFAIQVDDVRFYARGSSSALREGDSYAVDQVVEGEQVISGFDGRGLAVSVGTRFNNIGHVLAVAATGSTHTVEVAVSVLGDPIDNAVVEICAATNPSTMEDVTGCSTRYPALAQGRGSYVATVPEPPSPASGAPSPYVIYAPRTAPSPGAAFRIGMHLFAAYDYRPPAVSAVVESQASLAPAGGSLGFAATVTDDLAGGYLTASHSGSCASSEIGGWPTWGIRLAGGVASTTVHILTPKLCVGDNTFTFEAEDVVGRSSVDTVVVTGVDIPEFSIEETNGNARILVGETASFQVESVGVLPAGLEWRFRLITDAPDAPADPGLLDALTGQYTSGDPGTVRVDAVAVESASGEPLAYSSNIWVLTIATAPAISSVDFVADPLQVYGYDEFDSPTLQYPPEHDFVSIAARVDLGPTTSVLVYVDPPEAFTSVDFDATGCTGVVDVLPEAGIGGPDRLLITAVVHKDVWLIDGTKGQCIIRAYDPDDPGVVLGRLDVVVYPERVFELKTLRVAAVADSASAATALPSGAQAPDAAYLTALFDAILSQAVVSRDLSPVVLPGVQDAPYDHNQNGALDLYFTSLGTPNLEALFDAELGDLELWVEDLVVSGGYGIAFVREVRLSFELANDVQIGSTTVVVRNDPGQYLCGISSIVLGPTFAGASPTTGVTYPVAGVVGNTITLAVPVAEVHPVSTDTAYLVPAGFSGYVDRGSPVLVAAGAIADAVGGDPPAVELEIGRAVVHELLHNLGLKDLSAQARDNIMFFATGATGQLLRKRLVDHQYPIGPCGSTIYGQDLQWDTLHP